MSVRTNIFTLVGLQGLTCAFILALCLLSASATYAQGEQTPENAQRFLKITLPSNFTLCNSHGCTEESRVTPIEPGNECHTKYQASYNTPGVGGIYWDGVVSVERSRSQVTVRNGTIVKLVFDFGSEQLATRAAFAMEFLKQHCDPAKDTGF